MKHDFNGTSTRMYYAAVILSSHVENPYEETRYYIMGIGHCVSFHDLYHTVDYGFSTCTFVFVISCTDNFKKHGTVYCNSSSY